MRRYNLKKNRRSQAALEFLTTYAWAFLVIIITIAALAYFGVLSPNKLLPDRCNFGSEISCMQYVIKENGLQLKLKNNVGGTIIVDSLAVSSGKNQLTCNSVIVGMPWEANYIIDAPIVCDFSDAGLIENEKGKLSLDINYHAASAGSSFSKNVQGEVFGVAGTGAVEGFLGSVVSATCNPKEEPNCPLDDTNNANKGIIQDGQYIWYDVSNIPKNKAYDHVFDLGAVLNVRRIDLIGYSTGCWSEDGKLGCVDTSHNDNNFDFYTSTNNQFPTSKIVPTQSEACSRLDDGCWVEFNPQNIRYLRVSASSFCGGCINDDYVDYIKVS